MKTLAMRKAFLMPIWAVLAIGVLILPAAADVSAQAPPPDKRIEEIEKQVQALKQSVEDLRRDLLRRRNPKTKERSSRCGRGGSGHKRRSIIRK